MKDSNGILDGKLFFQNGINGHCTDIRRFSFHNPMIPDFVEKINIFLNFF